MNGFHYLFFNVTSRVCITLRVMEMPSVMQHDQMNETVITLK